MALNNLPRGPLLVGREIIITTGLRFAAGVCVLSTGLLVGGAGGAIAWADETDSSGSTAQSQGTEGPSSDVGSTPSSDVGSTREPVKKVAQPLETTLQGNFQTVTTRSLQKQGQQESTDPKPAQ